MSSGRPGGGGGIGPGRAHDSIAPRLSKKNIDSTVAFTSMFCVEIEVTKDRRALNPEQKLHGPESTTITANH